MAAERVADALRRRQLRQALGLAPIEVGVLRHRRVAVDATALDGDEVGAQVPLLEHPHRDIELAGDRDRLHVQRAAVAEQVDGVDIARRHERSEEVGPLGHRAPKRDHVGAAVERRVAGVEVDLDDLGPAVAQLVGQPAEERPVGSLQQQDAGALEARRHRTPPDRCGHDSLTLR